MGLSPVNNINPFMIQPIDPRRAGGDGRNGGIGGFQPPQIQGAQNRQGFLSAEFVNQAKANHDVGLSAGAQTIGGQYAMAPGGEPDYRGAKLNFIA